MNLQYFAKRVALPEGMRARSWWDCFKLNDKTLLGLSYEDIIAIIRGGGLELECLYEFIFGGMFFCFLLHWESLWPSMS